MKTIPRIGGTWWPACIVLTLLLFLLPLGAFAQDGQVTGDEGTTTTTDTGEALETDTGTTSAGMIEDNDILEIGEVEEPMIGETPIESSEEQPAPWEQIDQLRPDSTVMVVFDYDSGTESLDYAASLAVLNQCFRNDLNVIAFTNWMTKAGFTSRITDLDEDGGENPFLTTAVGFINGSIEEIEARRQGLSEDQLKWLKRLANGYFGSDTAPVDAAWVLRVLDQPLATTYIEMAFAELQRGMGDLEYGSDFINFGYLEPDEQIFYTARDVDYIIHLGSVENGAMWLDWWEENPEGNNLWVPMFSLASLADYETFLDLPGWASATLPLTENYPIPGDFMVEDRSNDEGGAIAIRWGSTTGDNFGEEDFDFSSMAETMDESTIKWGIDPVSGEIVEGARFEYWVFHSETGEEDSYELMDIVPSNTGFIWQAPDRFGFFLSEDIYGTNEHYAVYRNTYPEFGIYSYSISSVGMPMFQDLSNLSAFNYILVCSDDEDTIDTWLDAAGSIPVGVACSESSVNSLMRRYEEIDAFVGGEQGAYEYHYAGSLLASATGDETEDAGTDEDEELIRSFSVDFNGDDALAMPIMRSIRTSADLNDEELDELVNPVEGPDSITPEVQALYEAIEGLGEDSSVLIVMDIERRYEGEDRVLTMTGEDTAEFVGVEDSIETLIAPESEEILLAAGEILNHLFMGDAISVGVADDEISQIWLSELTAGADYGFNFVNLGFMDSFDSMIGALNGNIPGTFPQDFAGNTTDPNAQLISAMVYDDEKDYNNVTLSCNLSPLDGEKVFLEYQAPPEGAEGYEWDNVFETELSLDLSGLRTNKSYYVLFSADVDGKNKVTLEVQPQYDEVADIILIGASDGEPDVPDNRDEHWFKVFAVPYGFIPDAPLPPESMLVGESTAGFVAAENGWNWARTNTFLFALFICGAVLFFITKARRGASLFVRRIAGLDHVEEAIGRATEMGRPILYSTGLGSVSDIATIASMNILGRVARKVADYDSRIINPHRDPITMTVCQEVVQEAYIDAGRPDAFNKDDVFFLTDDQFAYTAAVDGIMMREKPATIFLMGMFYAESLLLAETGSSTGAIQIAGTDALAQLPFFITACDYTLIGEELYAASAYLSKEPLLLGSLKGQDLAKMVFMILAVVGTIWLCIGQVGLPNPDFFQLLFQVF